MKRVLSIVANIVLSPLLLALLMSNNMNAQNSPKQTLTILNVDSKGIPFDAHQCGSLTRMEVERLDTFAVTDKYDVSYLLEKHQLDVSNCYGKICLVEIGKVIGTDKMIGGSIEKYGESIIINLKLIDVKSESVEKTVVMEYLNLPMELQTMIMISIKKMFDRPIDSELIARLTKEFNYDNLINNPHAERLNLTGPRMGVTFFTGDVSEVLQAPRSKGGYDATSVMWQVGYQFEVQYLNEGNYQALFEFVPIITGLDQSQIIPSISILNGFRNNKYGWEFAFGPNFSLSKSLMGYFDNENVWHKDYEWDVTQQGPLPYDVIRRMDSRGDYRITSNFVFAVGKTLKSGKLNIPINAFVIPSKNGTRFGVSFGYNAKRNKRKSNAYHSMK